MFLQIQAYQHWCLALANFTQLAGLFTSIRGSQLPFCQLSLKAEHQDVLNHRAASLVSCITVFLCFHGVNVDTLHTNRAGLAEEEEEANTFAVLHQAGKAAVSSGFLATEMLASHVPSCSKTQEKGSISRFEGQATTPEGCLYCQLSRTQLLLRHRNAALRVLSTCGTDRKQL